MRIQSGKNRGAGRRGRAGRGAALAAICLWLSTSACSRAGGGGPAEGETARLYRRQCAACHGPHGAGGEVGPLKVADLRAPHAVAYTNEDLFKKIYEGGGGMPPFKYSLSDRQMYDLVRFIRQDIQKDGKK